KIRFLFSHVNSSLCLYLPFRLDIKQLISYSINFLRVHSYFCPVYTKNQHHFLMNGMKHMSFFRKESSLQEKEKQMKQVSVSLDKNINFIRTQLCDTEDLLMKEITWNEHQGMLVYLNTMINSDQFQRIFLAPSTEMKQTNDLNSVVNDLLSGSVAIFIESEPTCYLCNIIQSNPRSPDEPDSEKIVRGSHIGFVENFEVNLNMIRERVKNRHLKIEYFTLGKEENSTVAMIYLHNVVNETLVQKVRKRINANNSDMVFSPGYLEEDIEDSPASPFPQVLYTERPDRV